MSFLGRKQKTTTASGGTYPPPPFGWCCYSARKRAIEKDVQVGKRGTEYLKVLRRRECKEGKKKGNIASMLSKVVELVR